MDSLTSTPPLGKYLASSDKKVRDKAIKNLSMFLSNNSQEPLPKHELAKLWKGVFYCYWMSDKPLVQQALASELAELLLAISTTAASLAFLRAFWEATVREWNGLDRLRLNKYYMLIRRFTNAAFRVLIRVDWQEEACEEYNNILSGLGGPLCPEDKRVPSSLAYHLADIYLQELNKAVQTSPSCSPVPLYTMLSPLFFLAARTPSSVTYKRIQTSIFEPLFLGLVVLSSRSTQISDNDSDEMELPRQKTNEASDPAFPDLLSNSRRDLTQPYVVTPQELKRVMYRCIFDVASQQETRDSNRKKMYALWKEGADDVCEE